MAAVEKKPSDLLVVTQVRHLCSDSVRVICKYLRR